MLGSPSQAPVIIETQKEEDPKRVDSVFVLSKYSPNLDVEHVDSDNADENEDSYDEDVDCYDYIDWKAHRNWQEEEEAVDESMEEEEEEEHMIEVFILSIAIKS